MNDAARRMIAELLPDEGRVRPHVATVDVDPDGIATATIGKWFIAAWTDVVGRGVMTVAAYSPDGRCRHLWSGPPDAPHEASDALRADGLPVRHVEAPHPKGPTTVFDETSVGDTLDLFSA